MVSSVDKLNTALSLHQEGRIQEAERLYNEVLQKNPHNDVALYFIGVIAYQNSDFDKAVFSIKRAIEINPTASYYKDLGDIYLGKCFIDEAINCYKKAIELGTYEVETYYCLGVALKEKKNLHEAAVCFKKVLESNPYDFDACFNLGNIYLDTNNFDEAIIFYQKALKINQDYSVYFNLGLAFQGKICEAEAVECFKKTIELKPDFTDALYLLGIISYDLCNFDDAEYYCNKALEVKPDCLKPYIGLSSINLYKKNFEKGWEYFEKRHYIKRENPITYMSFSQPMWDGRPIQDKTLYAYYDRGFGDTIMFSRYIPLLKSFAKKVIFKPQAEVSQLLRQNDLGAEIVDFSTPDESLEFDYFIPLMSFPYIFKTNENNVPFRDKYLKSDKDKVNFYKKNYFNNECFKIGIVWQCNYLLYSDKIRSIPDINFFKNIAQLPNVKLYSLQKGKAQEQLKNLDGFNVVDLGTVFNDFSDTAAAIENLDLVISVDTSVVHLAGAMGKPTWVMVQYAPDWKWGLDTDKCYWYESVRIFRQSKFNDWSSVIEKVYNELANFNKPTG